MEPNKVLYQFVLRLADHNMIMAQRMAEWWSRGPILEEDLALTNISLDLLGQAELFYDYAVELSGVNQCADDLAFLRSERAYLNCLLVEQPNGDYANTMVKLLLFSCFEKHLYTSLLNSTDQRIADLAAKGIKEVRYHYRHSSDWVVRLSLGTEESKQRIKNAMIELWRFVDDMFDMNEIDRDLISSGISVDLNTCYTAWKSDMDQIFNACKIEIPHVDNIVKGGIHGIHTEHLGHILCEMQFLQRAHPGAKW
ncbi:MAG: 1,2-phenylacetyl-CoA epoxidase subunit PaaC [Saprospiraceae bacterium]